MSKPLLRNLLFLRLIVVGWAPTVGLLAAEPGATLLPIGKEYRHRANVLLLGDAISPGVGNQLHRAMEDEANFFRPAGSVPDLDTIAAELEGWLRAKAWDAVFVGLAPGTDEGKLARIGERVKQAHVLVAWGNPTPNFAAAIAVALHRELLSQSPPWATIPASQDRDPARLLADPQLLSAPQNLRLAQGANAVVYRAEPGGWQFNLHSFLAHHEGKFWAVWSSGRVDEDSSSQFVRYATSGDGLHWSKSQVLAPDPDGESGPWRWMASGVYEDGGRLFALGSLNRGNRDGQVWADARLVRFEWTKGQWKEESIFARDCVVYFPPLQVRDRDFLVWRDSYAHFSTAVRPSSGGDWVVTRLPGPRPGYRMSETSAYVDPQGVVHLIIRDQGLTHRIYQSVSYDAGSTWTLPVKTNYPDAVSKNCSGRLSNGWYYLINNPNPAGLHPRDPLAITFSRDGWTFGWPMALRNHAPAVRYPGKAKGSGSYQYSHAIEYGGKLWVIYSTNKEDIEVSSFDLGQFHLPA